MVDWECVSLEPSWKVDQVPQLLDGPEVDDGSPIPVVPPPPDKSASEFDKEPRDCLEQMLLRRIFYEVGGKPDHGSWERLFEVKCEELGEQGTRRLGPVPYGDGGELLFLSRALKGSGWHWWECHGILNVVVQSVRMFLKIGLKRVPFED